MGLVPDDFGVADYPLKFAEKGVIIEVPLYFLLIEPPTSTPNPCGTRCECPEWVESWLDSPQITSRAEYHPHGNWGQVETYLWFAGIGYSLQRMFENQTSVILWLPLYFLGIDDNTKQAATREEEAWPLFEIQATVEHSSGLAYFLGRTRFLLWLSMLWWY